MTSSSVSMKFSSLAALEVVEMTTSSAANDENCVKMQSNNIALWWHMMMMCRWVSYPRRVTWGYHLKSQSQSLIITNDRHSWSLRVVLSARVAVGWIRAELFQVFCYLSPNNTCYSVKVNLNRLWIGELHKKNNPRQDNLIVNCCCMYIIYIFIIQVFDWLSKLEIFFSGDNKDASIISCTVINLMLSTCQIWFHGIARKRKYKDCLSR